MANSKLIPEGGSSYVATGLGGTLLTSTIKISALKLGDLVISNPAVAVASSNQGAAINAIGNEILRRFDITVDYPESKIFLTPNSNFDDPFIYENSGLEIRASQPGLKTYVVHDVTPDTAGSRGGFRVEDVLMQFDDIPLSTRSMSQTLVLFRSGGKHHVIVMRNGKPVTLNYVRDDIPVLKTGT